MEVRPSSIRVDSLTKSFGKTRAVGPINLEVKSGELVSLLGPSGCGKTTTLRMIAGLEQPTSGDIFIGDRFVNTMPIERRDIGMVFQSYALFPHLTVFENVAFGLRLRNISKASIQSTVEESLSLVGLESLSDRMPSQLSGGQQQRVSLARALAIRPAVLLFDEPLSNLDQKLREQMRDEIRRLQRKVGITAIYVTHDQSEAMAISDRVAVMNSGQIEQIDTPRQIYDRPLSLFVAQFLGQCTVFYGYTEAEHFVTEGGTTFPVESPGSAVTQERRHFALVIRPEGVILGGPNTNGDLVYAGIVEDLVYLGDKASIRMRLNHSGELLLAHEQPQQGRPLPDVGSELTVHVRPKHAVLVPSAGRFK